LKNSIEYHQKRKEKEPQKFYE